MLGTGVCALRMSRLGRRDRDGERERELIPNSGQMTCPPEYGIDDTTQVFIGRPKAHQFPVGAIVRSSR